MRSKKLLRQIKKNFQNESFEKELNEAIEILKRGGSLPNVSNFCEILESIPHFLDTIDNSYTQNETMLELANRSLEVSTKELYQANEQFRLVNQAISAMINSLDEGFLVIDKNGRCGSIVSNSAVKFIGRQPTGESLAEILNIKPEETESFNEWLQMLFNEAIPFEDLIELAPRQLDLGDSPLKIDLKLKPIRSVYNASITDIVLILIDVSDKSEAERKLGEQKLYTDMVIKYLNNKTNFIRVIQLTRETSDSMRSWASEPHTWNENLLTLSRELHTLKGGVNTFSMYQLGYKIHQIEDELLTFCSLSTNISESTELIRTLGNDLVTTLDDFLEKNKRIFSFNDKTAQAIKEIPTNNIYKFCAELFKAGQIELVKYYVDQIVAVPFISLFASIEANVYSLSLNMDKPVEIIFLDLQLVKVIPEFYSQLFEQLVHIFNNILDHGIEDTEQRLANQKPASGKIIVRVELKPDISGRTKGWLNLAISDDGRGINPLEIREILNKRKVLNETETDEQVIYHILDQGFSTAESTTLTSGRGVGMAAVKQTVEEMGGQLSLNSKVGSGTTFIITVPYISEIDKNMVAWMTNNNNINNEQALAS